MVLVKNGSLATADVKDGTLTVADFLAGQVLSGAGGPGGRPVSSATSL
jgi:hypothetical protein